MKSYLFRWLPLLFTMVFIFAASMNHNPYLVLPAILRQFTIIVGKTSFGEVELFGKPGHIIEFALLGFTALRALIWKRKFTIKLIIITLLACELYALSDEIHQIFVPGRAFDIPDLFIDGAGILIGLLIYWFYTRSLRLKKDGKIAG